MRVYQLHRFEIVMKKRTTFGEYITSLVTLRSETTKFADTDDDIEVGAVELTRTCPITLQPIKYPCKGSSCKHIDVHYYIIMSSQRTVYFV